MRIRAEILRRKISPRASKKLSLAKLKSAAKIGKVKNRDK